MTHGALSSMLLCGAVQSQTSASLSVSGAAAQTTLVVAVRTSASMVFTQKTGSLRTAVRHGLQKQSLAQMKTRPNNSFKPNPLRGSA